MHPLNQQRRHEGVFEAFRRWPLVMVGPAHLRPLEPRLGWRRFVEVPERPRAGRPRRWSVH